MPLHATDKRARSFRDMAHQDVVLYVRPTGSDSNTGLSADKALKTLGAAVWEIEKDFLNGTYTIDITGCTLNEPLRFPQIRSGTFVSGEAAGEPHPSVEYFAAHKGAVNIRAEPVASETITSTAIASEAKPSGQYLSTTITFAGVAWTPGEHAGRTLHCLADAPDPFDGNGYGRSFYRVVDNTANTLTIAGALYTNLPGLPYAFIDPGARVVLGPTATGGRGKWTIDGVGGYVFSGIEFDLADQDESLISTNCSHTVYELCWFRDSSGGGSRIRTGGIGLARYIRCNFSVALRLVGGNLFLAQCYSGGGSNLLSSGSAPNLWSLSSPMGTHVTITDCWINSLGYGQGNEYHPAYLITNSTFNPGGGDLLFQSTRATFRYVYTKARLSLDPGSVLGVDGGDLLGGLEVAATSRVHVSGACLDGTLVAGAQTAEASTALPTLANREGPSPYSLTDPTQDAAIVTVYAYRPNGV